MYGKSTPAVSAFSECGRLGAAFLSRTQKRRRAAALRKLLTLQNHRRPHPARRADGHQSVLLAGELQLVADGGHDARAGRAEGMAERDGAASAVDLFGIDLADGLAAA